MIHPTAVPKYDGITRHGLHLHDERMRLYIRDRGRCRSCGKPVPTSGCTVAHLIADSKANRSKYGAEIDAREKGEI
jgi:5-methylcytosine-specific restriction endonuclease McrA